MKQQYGISEFVVNVLNFIYTKLFWPSARLIRRPFYIRGRQYMQYGSGFTTGYHCRFEMYRIDKKQDTYLIKLGQNCKFGDRVHLSAVESITIGDNCLFASNILVTDNEHGSYAGSHHSSPYEEPDKREIYTNPVAIGKNCWIGENVVILPGATLGHGVVVGANSLVKGNFPDNCIIGGSPAKILKIYNDASKKWEKIRN